jgi:hypothetical protein
VEFGKRGSTIDQFINSIIYSTQSNEEEAAECLIVALFNRFEETFVKVAMDKGVMPNAAYKMDIERVEAMLCDRGRNTKNSRILFQHLNHFFGRSFFESEKKPVNIFMDKISPLRLTKFSLKTKQSFTTGTGIQLI